MITRIISDEEKSSHRRAILWRTFWEVLWGFWGGFFRSLPPDFSEVFLCVDITKQNAFWGNFLEVRFRIKHRQVTDLDFTDLQEIRFLRDSCSVGTRHAFFLIIFSEYLSSVFGADRALPRGPIETIHSRETKIAARQFFASQQPRN